MSDDYKDYYIFDSEQGHYEKFSKKKINFGLIFLFDFALIISGTLIQKFWILGSLSDGVLSKTSATIMWIFIGIIFIGSIILFIPTRATQIRFKEYSAKQAGINPNIITNKDFEKKIGKVWKKECKKKNPENECNLKKIRHHKFEEFKEFEKNNKLKEVELKSDDLTEEKIVALIRENSDFSKNFKVDK